MRVVLTEIDKIIPYDKNPRKNEKSVDKVASSLQEFGFQQPIVVDKNGVVIVGHTRLKAAIKLGLKEVPVVYAEDLTEEQAKAYRLADNKTAEYSAWDMDLLADELEGLEEFNFDMVPFGFEKPDEIIEDDFDEEEALGAIGEPITRLGNIWKMGGHRLFCGDATSEDDAAALMDGAFADLVVTDPPYNVDYEGATKDKLKIQNDKMGDSDFFQFLADSFLRMYESSKKGAAIYVFHADSEGYNFRSAFKAAGYALRQCLIWVKNSMVMGRQDYQWQHEPILYGWKDGASHAWYSDRKQTTLIHFDRPMRNAEHPTMKPIGLCAYLIGNSSKEGDVVLDPFGGSGSTLIACEQTGRVCYMMELDPKYCDVIVKRWETMTGETAELIK
jgi:DNA modification methylase